MGTDLFSPGGEIDLSAYSWVGAICRDPHLELCAVVVNQKHFDDATLGPGDLPDWDLGLNMELPDPPEKLLDWFADLEEIARFLVDLRAGMGRNFVIGIGDESRGTAQDLYCIDERGLDLELLRRAIGVPESEVNPRRAWVRSVQAKKR